MNRESEAKKQGAGKVGGGGGGRLERREPKCLHVEFNHISSDVIVPLWTYPFSFYIF